jgi:hypothetical protein
MRTLPQVDRANAGLQTELTKRRQKTSAPAIDTSVCGLGLAGEVRTALAHMDEKTRRAAIARAVQELDEVTISAVLTAPRILTDLSELDVDHLREQWRRKAMPAECARIEALEKAPEHCFAGVACCSLSNTCAAIRVWSRWRRNRSKRRPMRSLSPAPHNERNINDGSRIFTTARKFNDGCTQGPMDCRSHGPKSRNVEMQGRGGGGASPDRRTTGRGRLPD